MSRSKKFIDYLDEQGKNKNCQYLDFVIANTVIENHFLKGKLNTTNYVGKPSLTRNNKNKLSTQSLFDNTNTNTNTLASTSFYDNLSASLWNLTNKSTSESSYSLWQKEHDAMMNIKPLSFSSSLLPEDASASHAVVKTSKHHIDVSVNTISDLISIINTNAYEESVEYNIDLKSLHNIKTELCKLDNMIGMNSMKQSVLNQLVYFIQELHVGKDSSDFKHTVLYGPPGTGKTEVAKIIGNMYSKMGILKNNYFKKVTRNDLIAGYLGQTAIKTKKVIDECLGGVLFIDEAYSLANNSENDSYSKECLDILCESLSDHKNDLMVIIAGYEEELTHTFFKANKGLESRFIWRFTMEPYNSKELMFIFKKMVEEQGWSFLENNEVHESWFEKNKASFKNFGRDMELLLTYTKISHGRRVYGKDSGCRKKISKEDLQGGYDMLLSNRKIKEQPYFMHTIYT